MVTRSVEIAIGVVSVAMFVGSVLAVPWLLIRLPADHFVRPPAAQALGKRVARNTAGAVLVGLGLAMLVLPGQGVLTILLGISILDFPAKRRWVGRLLRHPRIGRAVQGLRAKAHRPPLEVPEAEPGDAEGSGGRAGT